MRAEEREVQRLFKLDYPVIKPRWHDRARQGLEAMQAAQREVQRLLELVDYPVIQPSWHDRARLIAAVVRKVLETTGKSYLDVNAESPVCGIVTKALAAMGYRKKQSTVSAALRGLRGTYRKRNKSRT
jgi:hypothetical protein